MQKFNMIKLIISLTSVLAVGCTLPSPQKRTDSANATDNAATFAVDRIDAKFTTVQTHPTFMVPVAKTLSVEVCLSDSQFSKAILGHKFIIKGGTKDQEVTTDGSGCLLWKDEVRYNHLANAAFVEVRREIIAHGFQKGSRTISLAVNPWETKVLALKDSTVDALIPHALSVQKLNGVDSKTGKISSLAISVKSMKSNIQQREITDAGTNYVFELQLEPKVYLKTAAGDETAVALGQGKFNAKVYLIHVSNLNIKKIIAESSLISVDKSNSDLITVSTQLKLQDTCTLGQYELGLDLIPVDGPEGLNPLAAVYSLGTCENLIGKQFLSVNNELLSRNDSNSSFSINSYALPQDKKSVDSKNEVKNTSNQNSNSMQKTGIRISPVTTIGRRIYITKSAYTKELRFNINICLENSVDRNTMRSQNLQVTGLDGKTLTVTTANTGCAQVEDAIEFNYFAAECWKTQSITVQSETLGLNEKIPVEINPLLENGIFFQDLRYPAKIQDSNANKCAEGISEITTTAFAFDTRDYNYSIDESLGLKIHKSGNLKMILSLNRPSLSSTRGADDLLLPVGKYRLRWAVLDLSVTDYKKATGLIYSIGEKDVTVRSNSTISEPITITMENIKAIGNINQILFEVLPIGNETKGLPAKLKTSTFRALTTLANKNDGSAVEVTRVDSVIPLLTRQFQMDKVQAKKETQVKSTKEFLAKDNGLTLVNLNNNQQNINNINHHELSLWIQKNQMSETLQKQFCQHWADDILNNMGIGYFSTNALRNKCYALVKQDVRRFFDVEFRYFINRIGNAKYLGGNFRDFVISQSFNISQGSHVSDGSGYSIDARGGVGVSTPPLLIATASFGVGANYTIKNHSDSESHDFGNSNTVGAGVSAEVETIPFELKLSQYEKCAVIRMNSALLLTNDKYLSELNSLSISAKQSLTRRGYLVCAGEKSNQPFTFNENYYVINQNSATLQAMNAYSSQNRPFFIALRGRGDLVTFISRTQESFAIPGSFNKDYIQSQILRNPAEPVFLRGLRTYPGQIITPP